MSFYDAEELTVMTPPGWTTSPLLVNSQHMLVSIFQPSGLTQCLQGASWKNMYSNITSSAHIKLESDPIDLLASGLTFLTTEPQSATLCYIGGKWNAYHSRMSQFMVALSAWSTLSTCKIGNHQIISCCMCSLNWAHCNLETMHYNKWVRGPWTLKVTLEIKTQLIFLKFNHKGKIYSLCMAALFENNGPGDDEFNILETSA